MRKLALSLVAILLTACAGGNVDPAVELKGDEGIAVLNLGCHPEIGYVEVYPRGGYAKGLGRSFGQGTVISCNEPELKTVKLAAGDYFVGRIGAGNTFADVDEADAFKFSVRRNSLSYVGNWGLLANVSAGRRIHVRISVVYLGEDTRKKLETTYPELFSRYDYVDLSGET
jgi:hypothetical protein